MSEAETKVDDETLLVLVDDAPAKGRRCIAQRSRGDARTMLRFVVGPDDRLVFDADARLPGRGLWLSADREVVKKAVARNLFAKAARRRVQVDEALPAMLEAQLVARCMQWLGLARRAGAIEIGFDQVERAARDGSLDLLVIASDAGADGVGKLDRTGLPTLRAFSSQEIGAALGRPSLVYVGLRPGRLTDRLRAEAHKLIGLRGPAAGTGRDDDAKAHAFALGEQGDGTGRHPRG